MRYLGTFLAVLLVAALASGASSSLTQGVSVWSETQTLTRAAPSTGSTDGIALQHAVAWRVVVCAPSGQAVTGGGVTIWVQTQDGLWADNPTLTALFSISSTGNRCQAVQGDLPVGVRSGRMLPAANAITLSGAGTTVTMKVEVQIQ